MKKRYFKVKNKINKFLEIVDLVPSLHYPRKIADFLGMKRTSLYYYWRELDRWGVVRKVSSSVWEVDVDKRLDFFRKIRSDRTSVKRSTEVINFSKNSDRAHGFQFTLPLQFEIPDSQKMLIADKLVSGVWTNSGGKRYLKPSFIFNSWRVEISTRSIVMFMDEERSIFCDNAEDGLLEAIRLAKKEVVFPLAKVIGRKLAPRDEIEFVVSRQHHALIKNDLAKLKNDSGERLFIRDDAGVLKLIVDKSFVDELEAVDKDSSPSDFEKTRTMVTSVLKTGLSFYDVRDGFAETNRMIQSLATSIKENNLQIQETHSQMAYYAENIKSHVQAIKQLGEGVEKLTSKVSGTVDLDFLKKNIYCVEDVAKYEKDIVALSSADKLALTEHINKLGGLK